MSVNRTNQERLVLQATRKRRLKVEDLSPNGLDNVKANFERLAPGTQAFIKQGYRRRSADRQWAGWYLRNMGTSR